jgi:hypothetical protein
VVSLLRTKRTAARAAAFASVIAGETFRNRAEFFPVVGIEGRAWSGRISVPHVAPPLLEGSRRFGATILHPVGVCAYGDAGRNQGIVARAAAIYSMLQGPLLKEPTRTSPKPLTLLINHIAD